MRVRPIFGTVLLALLVAGCGAQPSDPAPATGTGSSSAVSDAAPSVQAWTQIEFPELNVRFSAPYALEQVGEGDVWRSTFGDVFGFIVTEHRSDGLGDYALPDGFVESFAKDPSCDRLNDPDVYLPLNSARAMVCDVLKRDDGTYVIYVVGIGRPYEGFAFRESMIVWLRGAQDTVVLQGIAPLAPYSTAQEDLLAKYPDVEWASDEFTRVNAELDALLEGDLGAPSPEVAEASRTLWRIAEGLERINN